MEHILEICDPHPDLDLDGWYEIKPEYTVTVRPPDMDYRMQTCFVKMRQFKSEEYPHLAFIVYGACVRVYHHERNRIRVVHSPDTPVEVSDAMSLSLLHLSQQDDWLEE